MRDKKADTGDVPASPGKKHRVRRLLLLIALGAIAGYLAGVRLDEEKRGRLAKLMFEGREMWFRVFV